MMNLLSDFQVSIYTASATAFIISSILCFSIIKYNKNFITKSNNQKRLNTLNIVPLGGVAMAISFFISVRLLGEADSNIVCRLFRKTKPHFYNFMDNYFNEFT